METKKDIIEFTKTRFNIKELVSERVYRAYGNDAWALFSPDLLKCLMLIREGIGRPITVNNWHAGGNFDERGFRENLSDICVDKTSSGKLYTSGHVLGMAVDFDVKGMTANEVRCWITEMEEIFPCKIRLERKLNGKYISWVHLDVKYYDKNPKVYQFNV